MKIVLLTVKSGDPSDLHLNEKSFGLELQKQIKARGGKCITRWENEFLKLIIQGVDKPAIDRLVAPFIDAARRNQRHMEIIITEQEMPDDYDLRDDVSSRFSVRREKLTKTLMLELPSGVFVVSNICPNGRSAFAEEIGAQATRLAAWKRAVAAGVDQCLCGIVGTKEEFIKIAFPRPGLRL